MTEVIGNGHGHGNLMVARVTTCTYLSLRLESSHQPCTTSSLRHLQPSPPTATITTTTTTTTTTAAAGPSLQIVLILVSVLTAKATPPPSEAGVAEATPVVAEHTAVVLEPTKND